jgi:hypothetical protein
MKKLFLIWASGEDKAILEVKNDLITVTTHKVILPKYLIPISNQALEPNVYFIGNR